MLENGFTKISWLLLAAAVLVLAAAGPVHAATGKIYLSPSTTTIKQGSQLSIEARIDPGTLVQGVRINIGYDAQKLQLTSTDDSATAFPFVLAENTQQNPMDSTRSVSESGAGAVNGDSLIIQLRFKALASQGSTTITITGNAASGGTESDPATQNATIRFVPTSNPTRTPVTTANPDPQSPADPDTSPSSVPDKSEEPSKQDQPDPYEEVEKFVQQAKAAESNKSRNNKLTLAGGLIIVITVLGGLLYLRAKRTRENSQIAAVTPADYTKTTTTEHKSSALDAQTQDALEHVQGVHNPGPGNTITPQKK